MLRMDEDASRHPLLLASLRVMPAKACRDRGSQRKPS